MILWNTVRCESNHSSGGLPQCEYFTPSPIVPAAATSEGRKPCNDCPSRSTPVERARSRAKTLNRWNASSMPCSSRPNARGLGETLERLDVDLPFIEMDGRRHYRVLGELRDVYDGGRAGAGPAHAVPMRSGTGGSADGASGGGSSKGTGRRWRLGRRIIWVAHLTPQECESMLRELGNMTPSKSSLDRLPQGGECALGSAARVVRGVVARGGMRFRGRRSPSRSRSTE